MAEAFNTTVTALEEELMQLILDGKISARIDSHNKALMRTLFTLTYFVRPLHLSSPSPEIITGRNLEILCSETMKCTKIYNFSKLMPHTSNNRWEGEQSGWGMI